MTGKIMKDNNMKIKNNEIDLNKIADTKVVDTKVADTKVADTKVVDTKVADTKEVDTKDISEEKRTNNSTNKIELLNNKYQSKNKKQLIKPGRTILIKILDDISVFTDDLTENLVGLTNKTVITNNKTIFLTFDTVDNSYNAYNFLRFKSNKKYLVSFSYYKLFFIIKGLKDDANYNESKNKLIEFITKNTDINVLYFKFYCKDNKYLGCGDLTVDTLESLVNILSKELKIKEFSFKSYSGTFYKFTDKKLY